MVPIWIGHNFGDNFWRILTRQVSRRSPKFTYLRELVTPQVSRTIEALPFTAEGYNRAKSILKEKFGKDSEIIKAYTKVILELPTLTGTNPKAISDFSEKVTLLCTSFTNAKQARASKRSYFDDP